jgi:hypothetical protein
VADHVFGAGEYFFDPHDRNAALVRVPHNWGQDAPELPAQLFIGSGSLLKQHRKQATSLLEKCKPLDLGRVPAWAKNDE